jgi:hypothetical protein
MSAYHLTILYNQFLFFWIWRVVLVDSDKTVRPWLT